MTDAGPDPLIGHQVGRYAIQAYLRADRLGKVYLAHELPGKKRVDVKVLEPAYASNDELFARFGRELLATATVNHPNSVQMLDFGQHRGLFHYLVLEHLDARTVAEEIARHGPLPWERVARIAHQVGNALAAAHNEKIIHRSLSPANLLLLDNAEGDFVKIRDFGLSRLVDPDDPEAGMLTAAGARVGNVEYMAPEYISVGIVHRRGDLYALGAVMFEMLTGGPPFAGKSTDVLEHHLHTPAPRVSAVATVPAWLDDLVASLLAKEMDARPESGRAVARAIEQGMKQPLDLPRLTEAPRPRPAADAPVAAPPAAPGGLNRLALAAGFAVIALVCVAGALALGLWVLP